MRTADEWILIDEKNKRGRKEHDRKTKAMKHLALVGAYETENPGSILTTVCISRYKSFNDYDNIDHWLKMMDHTRSEPPHGLQKAGVTSSVWQQFVKDIDACGDLIDPYLTCCLSMPPFWVFGCLFCHATNCLDERRNRLHTLVDKTRGIWRERYGLSVYLNGSTSEEFQYGNKSHPMPKPPCCPKHYFGVQVLNDKLIEEFRVVAYRDDDDEEEVEVVASVPAVT